MIDKTKTLAELRETAAELWAYEFGSASWRHDENVTTPAIFRALLTYDAVSDRRIDLSNELIDRHDIKFDYDAMHGAPDQSVGHRGDIEITGLEIRPFGGLSRSDLVNVFSETLVLAIEALGLEMAYQTEGAE